MSDPLLEIVELGLGVSVQDLGRRGWKRYGVPPGGALDDHAAQWANVLLGNPLNAPVLEILFHGARFRALRRMELSLTGATVSGPHHHWQTRWIEPGEEWILPPPAQGVWSYLGVGGGFAAPRWFGSVGVYPRGGLGQPLSPGDRLHRRDAACAVRPPAVGSRWVHPAELREYQRPPRFRLWPGPQWNSFPDVARKEFFAASWKVSARSDRTGYRLEGPPLPVQVPSLPSEPALPGSIQIPPDGRPIVTMRDGPTVGGYPKLGLIDPPQLSWFAQCRPGQEVRFESIPELET